MTQHDWTRHATPYVPTAEELRGFAAERADDEERERRRRRGDFDRRPIPADPPADDATESGHRDYRS